MVAMSPRLGVLLIGVAIAAATAVGVRLGGEDGPWWALVLIGAIGALSLWGMLFAGTYAQDGPRRGSVAQREYAVAGAFAVVLGAVMGGIGDGATWWFPGFILAGVLTPVVARQQDEAS